MTTFLYAAKNPGVGRKNYTRTASGTTGAGVKIQRFESGKRFVDTAYRHGAILEFPKPGGGFASKVVFGSKEDVDKLHTQVERNPDKALADVKFMGNRQAKTFYLGQQAPPVRYPTPSKNEVLANKLYPNAGIEAAPETVRQQEKREFRQHAKEQLERQSNHPYPTSDKGEQARIETILTKSLGRG